MEVKKESGAFEIRRSFQEQEGGMSFLNRIMKSSGFQDEMRSGNENPRSIKQAVARSTNGYNVKKDIKKIKTILLAMPEDENFLYARESLRESGFNVVSANNGPDAVKAFFDLDGDVDLVISMVTLSNLSGKEVFKKMIASKEFLRFVLVADRFDMGIAKMLVAYKTLDVIQKAVFKETFLYKVQRILAERS
jgi:CheY-like chemotaxis protein